MPSKLKLMSVSFLCCSLSTIQRTAVLKRNIVFPLVLLFYVLSICLCCCQYAALLYFSYKLPDIFVLILNKFGFSQQILIKVSNIEFHGRMLSAGWLDMYGKTDVAKLGGCLSRLCADTCEMNGKGYGRKWSWLDFVLLSRN